LASTVRWMRSDEDSDGRTDGDYVPRPVHPVRFESYRIILDGRPKNPVRPDRPQPIGDGQSQIVKTTVLQ
jgi:hypothetical protein